jgi:hypothetical protein
MMGFKRVRNFLGAAGQCASARRMSLGQWRDTYTPFLQPESLPFFRRIVSDPSALVRC